MNALDGLRIAFLAGTLGQGGAERQLFYILRTLQEHGVHLRVYSLTKGEFWERRIRGLGIPVVWVGRSPSRWVRLLRILRELRRSPVDIVQSQHFYTNLYASFAARLLGFREVGALRNDAVSEVQANGRFFGPLSLRFPHLVAANSRQAIHNAELIAPPQRLYYLPNVVDTEHFRPAGHQRRNVVRLLASGRLVPPKRMSLFLGLLAKLRGEANLPVIGIIAGDGPLQAALEKQAQALGLCPGGVRFTGAVGDMRTVYKEADIFVLTSDWEGTPNVVLEAMACALPVVATRVGGVPEIVQDRETGFLVEPEDEASMVSALRRLIEDPDLRMAMGMRGRAFVEKNHTLGKMPLYLTQLYQKVLS